VISVVGILPLQPPFTLVAVEPDVICFTLNIHRDKATLAAYRDQTNLATHRNKAELVAHRDTAAIITHRDKCDVNLVEC